MSKKEPVKSWHRREKETPRQYALFEFFLSLPASERTSEKVCNKFAISLQYVQRVRAKNKWNERALDRDNSVAEKIDAKVQNKAEETAFDWIEWENSNLSSFRDMSDALKQRCDELLSLPIKETIKTTKVSDDGKTIHQTINKPVNVRASDIPKYIEATVILSRFVLEQSGGTRPAGNIALPKPAKPIGEMTPDERESYIAELKAAQSKIERGEIPTFDETQGVEQ